MARFGQGKQEETAQLLYAVEGVEVWIDAHPQGAELSTKCVTDTWGAAAPLFFVIKKIKTEILANINRNVYLCAENVYQSNY